MTLPRDHVARGGEVGRTERLSDQYPIVPRVPPPGQGASGTKLARHSEAAGEALVKSVLAVYTTCAARPGDDVMPFLEDVRQRHRRPEIMDQPGLDRGQHYAALRGL